jgi:zinc protease
MTAARALVLLITACAPKQATVVPWAVGADGAPIVPDDLEAPFPVDPGVKIGHLPNGLTYYIEPNERPARRAELRMVVKVGSIVEEENQRGIAHFLEHMAFNGSYHFPGNDAIVAIEATGARFGAHVNASTGFDETIYQLQVPTDDPRDLQLALRIFADQAGALLFDPDECAREVGVVTEEWRLDQGLPARVQAATFPYLFHGSRYVDRLPIGTADAVAPFDCEQARRFWEDWYRPDLMAVMAVGDFDPAKVEKLITELFSPLQAPPTPRERPWFRTPDHDELLVTVLADPEITDSGVALFDKVDDIEENRHAAYRQLFVEQLAWGVLNERLAIRGHDPGAPYTGAGAGESSLGYERAAQALSGQAREGRELEALEAMLVEVERLRRHGVTQAEVDRARAEAWIGMQDYYDEQQTTDSDVLIAEHVRVFTTNEPMPSVVYEFAMAQKYLPTITPAEVGAWAASSMLTGKSRVATLLMPQKPGLAVPTEAELRAVIERVKGMDIAPPEAAGAVKPLMSSPPAPGTVTDAGKDPELGTTTWRLGNGVTVILKPTDFQVDEIVFEAFSPGGTSVVADADYVPALTAVDILLRSGLGEHDAISLSQALAGKDVQVSPYIGTQFEGVAGGGSRRDMEALFQLLHLMFTAPRFEQRAFELERSSREEDLRNRSSNPAALLWDTYSELLWQGNPHYTNWKLSDLDAMDLARSEAVYKQRFGDATDFTFVFTGSFTPEELRPFAARYLATLPAQGRVEAAKDDGARMVPGVVRRVVTAGGTPRAHVVLTFHGSFESTWESRNTLSGMREVLQSALQEVLREERGGTYGVSVDASTQEGPYPTYKIDIDFECDPGRVEELVDATWGVIAKVKQNTATREGISIMQEQRRRDRETASRTNSFWADTIADTLMRGEDPHDLLGFEARNRAITGEAMRMMAVRVLNEQQYLMVIQRP